MKIIISLTAMLAGLTMIAASAPVPAPEKNYQVTLRFKAGGDSRWDLLTFDPAGKRLFISRADHVMVLDAASGKSLGEIPDTPGVHAIALAPEAGHGYTSNGRSNTLTVFDPATLKATGEIKVTGENPDVLLYDPFTRRLFAFNGRSANATVINTATGAVEATLPLDGRPELAVSDGKGRIFVNLEDKSEISVIDAKSLKVTANWPLAPGEEPTGLAFDVAHGRLFSVCANKKMIVLDAATGRKVAELPIGGGPDGAAFDPGTGMAFSANGDGTLTVVHEDDPEHFRVVANVATQESARTVALDPATHRLFLPAAYFSTAPTATPEQPRPRASLLPGSFTVLVVEPK